jgi:hypothetical protein
MTLEIYLYILGVGLLSTAIAAVKWLILAEKLKHECNTLKLIVAVQHIEIEKLKKNEHSTTENSLCISDLFKIS